MSAPAGGESKAVKTKAPRQTVCNIPTDNPKDPYCGGKLKRITELDREAKKNGRGGKRCFSVPKMQDALR